MHVLLQYPPKPVALQFSPHVFTCFEQLIFMPSASHPLLTDALSTPDVLTFATDFNTTVNSFRMCISPSDPNALAKCFKMS